MAGERNASLVDNLTQDFRRLNNPAHAWGDVISLYKMLPGLVGFWPCNTLGSSSSNTTNLTDCSGKGLHLTRNGAPVISYDNVAPFVNLDGASDYFSHADASAFDILGTESHVESGDRGLTMGAWVRYGSLSGTQAIMAKWASPVSYLLDKNASNYPRFGISSNGSSFTLLTHAPSTALAIDTWYFIVARLIPSSEMKVFLDKDSSLSTSSIPSSIYNSSSIFAIGSTTGGGVYHNGDISLAFLCKMALDDYWIETLYDFTAPLFGKV